MWWSSTIYHTSSLLIYKSKRFAVKSSYTNLIYHDKSLTLVEASIAVVPFSAPLDSLTPAA